MSVINKQAYGVGSAIFGVQQRPIIAQIDPTNQKAELGTVWINKLTNDFWVLTSVVAGVPNWATPSNGAGIFASLTVNPGDVTITAGNLNVTIGSIDAGGDITSHNQITATADITSNTGDFIATLGGFRALSGNYLAIDDSNNAIGPNYSGLKSRAGGIINTGDALGALIFAGSDGVTAHEGGAGIAVISTGTIGAGRVPAFMTFATTPDAVSAPIDRITIPADGGLVIDAPTTATTPPLVLPGPVNIYTGAGAPAGGLAINVGDMYINTTAASAVTRLYIATAANTWTNVTCAA